MGLKKMLHSSPPPSNIDGFLALGKFSIPYHTIPYQKFKLYKAIESRLYSLFFTLFQSITDRYYTFIYRRYSKLQNACDQKHIKLYSFDVFSTLLEKSKNNRIFNLINPLKKKVDINNLVPIHSNIEIIKKLLAEEKRVVLLADTAYSSDEIRNFLLQFESVFSDLAIYTTSAYKQKNLYKIVSIAENVDYKNWRHYTGKNIGLAMRLGVNVNIVEGLII